MMNNREWLLSLNDDASNNISKCLELLHHPENNFLRIHIVGQNGKSLTANFINNAIMHQHVGIMGFKRENVNNMFTYDNRVADDEDITFHAGCIKKITEDNGLTVSFYEAIFLIGLNLFREKKMTTVIIKGDIRETYQIGYDLTVCTDCNYQNIAGKVIAISDEVRKDLIAIKKRDIYIYKCEMCSFNYDGLDYDINMIGFFNAYFAVLAINAIRELYPEVKKKKLKKAINDTICIGQMERVNINPRIILNSVYNDEDVKHLKEIADTVYANKKVKYLSLKSYCLENEILVNDIEEIKKEIKSSFDNDVLFILGDNDFIHKVRGLFIK